MDEPKCPVCGCKKFYVKNPEDDYDVYVFTCQDGDVCFDEEGNDASSPPPVEAETETYCNDCAWHDQFQKIKINFK